MIAAACGPLWSPLSAASEPAGELEIVGLWYVLIHYSDSLSGDPDAVLWEDHLWSLERRGRRLVWSEYPGVELRDTSGRLVRLEDGREVRSTGAWEPNASQLAEIREGLPLAGQGVRTKSLTGSAERGWRSAGVPRAESASVIGYHESWRIEDPTTLPVFSRSDVMGAARTEPLAGRTRYTTREIRAGGDELRGEFERDGELRGRFRMLRMGAQGARTSRAGAP